MPTLVIELSDQDQAFVEARAAAEGFASPAEYVADLVRIEWAINGTEDDLPEFDLNERLADLKVRDPVAFDQTIQKLHQMSRDGLNSGPPIVMTEPEWGRIRASVRNRISPPEAADPPHIRTR